MSEKDGKFHSAALDADEKFSQTFSTPDHGQYFCSIHPQMTGKIVVYALKNAPTESVLLPV